MRELQNVVERDLILSSGRRLEIERAMGGPSGSRTPENYAASTTVEHVLTAEEVEAFERANLIRALDQCDWKVSGETGAARLLGIPATTLSSRMKSLAIRKQDR